MKWIEKVVFDSCPGYVFQDCKNAPIGDSYTAAKAENNHVIGCRGITCEQCWSLEVEEGEGSR